MFHDHVGAFRLFVNQLHLPFTRYQRDNFVRLGAAFLTRRSLPIRRLARTLAGPGKAHRAQDKRLRRFLGNPKLDAAWRDAALAAHLHFLLSRLCAVPFVLVMLDWTFVKGKAILWAHIPYRGRSLPLDCAVFSRPFGPDEPGQTKAEQQLLARLRGSWPKDAPAPLLLLDRGFDKGPLLSWLLAVGWFFVVRVQRGHLLYAAEGTLLNDVYDALGNQTHRGRLHPKAGEVLLFPHVAYYEKERLPVHLVVTARRDAKSGEESQWRLVTNVPEAYLGQVAAWYAQRMAPEEVHRDSKRGHCVSGFALSHLGRMRTDRLERYVFFLGLIYCFLVLVAETERETREWLASRHWGLSLATLALDLLHTMGMSARHLAHQACASVRLEPLWAHGGDY